MSEAPQEPPIGSPPPASPPYSTPPPYGSPTPPPYGSPTPPPPYGSPTPAPYGSPTPAPYAGGSGSLSPSDEKLWAMLSHLSIFVIGIIGPLIVMLTQGEKSPYVRRQAVEALNFHITVAIAGFVSAILIIILIGILMLIVVGIGAVVLTIMAAIAVNQRLDYRYPISLRLVK